MDGEDGRDWGRGLRVGFWTVIMDRDDAVRFYRAICLLMMIGALIGCRHPVRAITSNKIFIPRPVSARVTSVLEKTPKTEPIRATVVSAGAGGGDCPRIALIDVDGLLVNAEVTRTLNEAENPVALFREKIDAAASDPRVSAFVVRINSPGGGVVASNIMFHELEGLRERTGRPVVTYIMEVGTGGGYYLATAGDLICAHPNSVTGGIGVIFNYYNLEDAMGQQNVTAKPIRAGKNIDMGSYGAPLTEETREWLQEMADEFHGRFIDDVVRRRPSVDRGDDSIFDGRVFAAPQAQRHGLIDQVGHLEEAIEAAQQMVDASECAVVMYHRESHVPRSIYAGEAQNALPAQMMPLSIPGLERSRLPSFLYLWQVEPTLERLGKP